MSHDLSQSVEAVARKGRDGDTWYRAIGPKERPLDTAGQEIYLVEDLDDRLAGKAKLSQDRVYGPFLLDHLGVTRVDQVEEQIGLVQLLEGGLERRDQLRRKSPDESNRVG